MEPNKYDPPVQKDEVREVVGIFGTMDRLQSAIDELLSSGFDRAEISLLAEDGVVRSKVGNRLVRELADADDTPRTPYIESESLNEAKAGMVGVLFYVAAFAGAGAMLAYKASAANIITAALTAGAIAAIIGIGVAKLIGNRENRWAQAQLERGGLLLWARVWNEERARTATDVMARNGGTDIHLHAAG